jgi:ribonuclease BN (tRNA processing enzyme)
MELTVLGSGTCVPSLTRGSAGLLIRVEEKQLLFDSGSGTLGRMLKAGATYNDIDILCYTHTHPDHTADLIPFLFVCKYGDPPRTKELHLIGAKGFEQFFNSLKAVYRPWIEPEKYRLNLCEMETDCLDFEGFRLMTRPMKHSGLSIGYRVETEDGQSITISGDTDYCPNIVALAKESHLLVLECSFPNQYKADGHLTPALAGQIAKAAGCRKLLLTHFYPICDQYDIVAECRASYDGEIILAQDGLRLVV